MFFVVVNNLNVYIDRCRAVGKYKVEMFDKDKRSYMPTTGGLGMHVEVRDPDEKTLMSRVSFSFAYLLQHCIMHIVNSCILSR